MAAKVSAKSTKKDAARSTSGKSSKASGASGRKLSVAPSPDSPTKPKKAPAPAASAPAPKASKAERPVRAPVRIIKSEPPPKQLTLEERWAQLEERLAKTDAEFQRAYRESLDMSWIYHDSALEGSVYTPVELRAAVEPGPSQVTYSAPESTAQAYPSTPPPPPAYASTAPSSTGSIPPPASIPPMSRTPDDLRDREVRSTPLGAPSNLGMGGDSNIQPISEEIRRHREALDYIRDYASKKRQPITIDVVKKIYLILHPEEGDIKTVKYRKDIPQHRLYFHEYAPPDKITYKVRQILDWTNDPETRRTRSAVRIAARAHYDLLRVFPFTTDSGKVARLFMNLLLMRAGFPPAIVHSTERQRYYEALKGASAVMTQIVAESIENNVASVEKLLEAHESKGYAVKV